MTAADASALPDVFLAADPQHCDQSKDRLRAAYDAGAISVCDIVYAEPTPSVP